MKLIVSKQSKSNVLSNIHPGRSTTLFLSDEEIHLSKTLIEKELFFIKTQQSKSKEEKDIKSVSFWNLMESMFKTTHKKLKPKTQLNFGELDSYYGVLEMSVVDMTKSIFTLESIKTIQSLKLKIQAIHRECIAE
ncbi:hypothetical protein [Bacillus sp. NPDC094106]|uniref:hypothetical protein n=1 Tax=Bacillus sp. NPDC094106 TaxID=3363949 RepID=UPI003805D7F5